MLKVTWRNLVARKIRLLLSAAAIILGVAFVAGSFIFTDGLGGAFDGIVKGTTADVEVLPEGAGDVDAFGTDARTLPASLVDELSDLPGAASVAGTAQVPGVYVISADGDLIGGNGPPGLALNYNETTAITGDQILTLASGDLPSGDSEVALDVDTADKAGYDIGDEVTLATPGDPPVRTATLTGTVRFGSEGGLVGATITVFDITALQDLFFAGQDVYTNISLTAADGVSQADLADEVAAVLPEGVEARAGDEFAAEQQQAIDEILGFINTFLLVFAAVSLIVGTFLIINTFSILVAQRSRELALLRAMGASRRQVNRSVLTEAFVVSLVGSTVGLALGYLLAIGLKALFAAFGLDIGSADLPVQPRTVIVAYLVGILVTLVAAYVPARRASRIAPVEAMRDEVAMPESTVRRRVVIGVVMIAVGIGAMAVGLAGSGGGALALIGLGMLLILIGVALISPVVGRPVVRLCGWVFRSTSGTVGVLATENSLRNPRRTAATASALMIGLTLVTLMSILGSSASASTDQAIEEDLSAELIVSNAIQQPFSAAYADQIRDLPGVASVAQFRTAGAELDGSQAFIQAVNPDVLGTAVALPMQAGAADALDSGQVLLNEGTASGQDVGVGDEITVDFPAGPQTYTVGGIFPNTPVVNANVVMSLDSLEQAGIKPEDSLLLITKDPSASESEVRGEIDDILSDNPTVTLKNQQEFADEQKALINQFLAFIYALLALAIVIALLGIVNTLALSVVERTREIGLLRAIGFSRRQTRTMIRLESIAIAVLGAVLGVVMGVAFGIALQREIADDGVEVLSIPWLQLVVYVVAAAVIGVAVAVFPARRAAKLDVLDAITTQ